MKYMLHLEVILPPSVVTASSLFALALFHSTSPAREKIHFFKVGVFWDLGAGGGMGNMGHAGTGGTDEGDICYADRCNVQLLPPNFSSLVTNNTVLCTGRLNVDPLA